MMLSGIRAGMACCRGLCHLPCCSCCQKSVHHPQDIQVHHRSLGQMIMMMVSISSMYHRVMRVCMLHIEGGVLLSGIRDRWVCR